jgi:hypothetical protein
MKYTYKKMASGGKVGKGYTEKERKGLRKLIEEVADPYAGDVTGGSSVTVVKKKVKKMARGGDVGIGRRGGDVGAGRRGGGGGMGFKAMKAPGSGADYFGGGGMDRSGRYGGRLKAGGMVGGGARDSGQAGSGYGGGPSRGQYSTRSMPSRPASSGFSGGRPGSGMGVKAYRYKSGGIVGAPARSHRDMRAGAGSGVGRIQKTKIQRGR